MHGLDQVLRPGLPCSCLPMPTWIEFATSVASVSSWSSVLRPTQHRSRRMSRIPQLSSSIRDERLTFRYAEHMDESDIKTALLAEIRAWMGRRQVNQTDMARHMGLTRSAVSRRMSGQQDFTFPELASIAGWLDITLAELLGPVVLQARRSPHTDMVGAGASGSLPRLDSNQQPFD
ncbi:helix-turn-helix transcriptional regulator [Micrococcus luteus]|uniref:helix-turn-helix domain-containing protein n=1 Tax=Micrococcus luteus TaxID=1270 RepID=UPI003F13F615